MKRTLLILYVLFCSSVAMSQVTLGDAPKGKDRLYFGGGIGLNAGTNSQGYRYFYVGLYPVVGYMLNEKASIGTGLTWQHYEYSDIGQTIDQYGVSPFFRYNLGQMFAYSEYMFLNSPVYDNNGISSRQTYNRWLMGIGYSQPIGRRSAVNAIGMYDVLWKSTNYFFSSPWVFRIYFTL